METEQGKENPCGESNHSSSILHIYYTELRRLTSKRIAVNDGEGEIYKDGIVYYPKPPTRHCFWRQMKTT